jgi:tetratricopeptide (TPR) repeat protein
LPVFPNSRLQCVKREEEDLSVAAVLQGRNAMSVKVGVADRTGHFGMQDNQHVLRKSNWRPSSSPSAAARSKSASPSSSSSNINNRREGAAELRARVSFADARPQEEKVEERYFEPPQHKTPPPLVRRVSKKRHPNGSSPGGANINGKENNGPPATPAPAFAMPQPRTQPPFVRKGSKKGRYPGGTKVLVTPPQNSQKASLLQRLSGRLSGKPGFVKMASVGKEEFENMGGAEEEDPVMTIFENRNTRRIRFTLEGRVSERGFPKIFLTSEEEEEKQSQNAASSLNIKHFMSRALFGGTNQGSKPSSSAGNSNKAPLDNEEIRREAEKEMGQSDDASLVWESAATPMGPEVIHTQNNHSQKRGGGTSELLLSFTENPKARAQVVKILKKARQAQHIHFRYEYAVKCYVKVLDILTKANYPDDHPTVQKTMRLLNNSHHVLSSYTNSANIVKMGIKYEDAGELVRALKMYTIAYRIRRDNLSRHHPSLVVLLNMLGSIQMKRNELKEAMQIYELALRDAPVIFSSNHDDEEEAELEAPSVNLMAKSVTYREMGTVYERWGMFDEALNNFHKSLECVEEWKETMEGGSGKRSIPRLSHEDDGITSDNHCSFSNINLSLSSHHAEEFIPGEDSGVEKGEMELHLASANVRKSKNLYESFFPPHLEELLDKEGKFAKSGRDDYADVDLALTLHQIAQLHRCQGHFADALNAYEVALRGMKYALGKHHPNVAAVLGNIGNLQKEMGDLDGAYLMYQEVLGIESYRLGLSHPDVAITLHNIATIDAARGNYTHALTLYRKVITLQKKLLGEDNFSVAVTAACMGDVYERKGQLLSAMESFEEAARIKSVAVGRHSLDVSRLLHKLGKLAFARHDYHMAESYISRATLIYRLHKLDDDHEWVIDANRDTADIDGAIAMGGGRVFEC